MRSTTTEEDRHDFKMVLRKDRKPSFLPNHGDDDDIHDGQVSDEDEHTDVLEF